MVELRSRTHLNSHMHYIRSVKDGAIKTVMNVGARSKSKLRFRQLVDVYNRQHCIDDESIPRVVRDLGNVSDMTQASCLFGAEVNIKTDPEDFSMITLDKIRKQCKDKKRKLRNRRDIETPSNVQVKKECLTQDEGCDTEEPLSNWNTKFSKRRKKKQERIAKRGSTSPPSMGKVDLPVFFHVKPEAWDDSYSVTEAMDFIPTDHLLDCNKESESPSNTVLVEEIMHDSSKDTRLALYSSTEPNSPRLVTIAEPITTKPEEMAFEDASEEFDDARKAQCCLQNKEIILYGSVSREEIETEVPEHSDSENIVCVKNLISYDKSLRCEEVKEDEESNGSKPNLDMTITGLEIVKIEAPEMLPTDYSDLPIMDFGVEKTEIVWETEDIAKDDLLEATDILQLTNCCNSLDNLQPVPDDSAISFEEDQLPKIFYSKHKDEAGDHKSSQLYKALDEIQNAAETDSFQQQKLHHQPGKLLSGRKALSPTSQAKLRKAMAHPDSPEKRSKKSKGKLYFSSQHSRRILKAEGLDNINRVDVIPISKQVIRKANNNTPQTQYQRATHKFPRRDTQAAKAPPFSTGCPSLQGCSQKAIAFSQGQMRDFQYVAVKLTKELKSMRQITKRCLLAERNTSNMSECNLDEVKTLIGNAEKTEESSKKWLSIIERDCNRFCKLMGMVREESPATENIVQKKKKIKFADDAGGDLCHVKVFEIDLESESKS